MSYNSHYSNYRIIYSMMTRSLVLLFLTGLLACGEKTNKIVGIPRGYDLNHPKVVKLPPALNEISGLTYYGKDTSLFAIQDEEGFLYKIFPNHPDMMLRWKFSGHGDFEDLVLLDSSFYILRSDGSIFLTRIRAADSIEVTKYDFPDKGDELESLYYDEQLQRLILVCKDCGDKKKTLSTFAFDPAARQFGQSPFEIDVKEIARILSEKSIRFKPSAAALHPLTHQLYILSSVNKLLVIANRDGSVVQAYNLDPVLYKQPEGLAFGPDGTMYVSNESHNEGAATLLVIPYRLTKKP